MAAQFDHSGLKRRTAPAVRIEASGDGSLVFGLAEVPPMPSLRTHAAVSMVDETEACN